MAAPKRPPECADAAHEINKLIKETVNSGG